MNISKIGNTSFNGLLTISGPDKENDVIVNTDQVATIGKRSILGPKGDYTVLSGPKTEAMILMNNGFVINTSLPVKTVVEAYKQAKGNGEATLEAQIAPEIKRFLFNS